MYFVDDQTEINDLMIEMGGRGMAFTAMCAMVPMYVKGLVAIFIKD